MLENVPQRTEAPRHSGQASPPTEATSAGFAFFRRARRDVRGGPARASPAVPARSDVGGAVVVIAAIVVAAIVRGVLIAVGVVPGRR